MINEIEVMRALNHQNIIKLYEIYETENSIYLVMEKILEKNLELVMNDASSSKVNIQKIIFSLLETLSYLDSQNILHLNIKPRNIIVDYASNIKIANFALSLFGHAPKEFFRTCGTPGYMAPEIINSDDENEGFYSRCDIYSAGCVFFEM